MNTNNMIVQSQSTNTGITTIATTSQNTTVSTTVTTNGASSQSSQPFSIPITLGDYPHIVRRLNQFYDDHNVIYLLHNLLYNVCGQINERKSNILKFKGYDSSTNLFAIIQRLVTEIKLWTRPLMGELMNVLGGPRHGTRSELIEKIVFFFASPTLIHENSFVFLPIAVIVANHVILPMIKVNDNWKGGNCFQCIQRSKLLANPLSDTMSDNTILNKLLDQWRILSSTDKKKWDYRARDIVNQLRKYGGQLSAMTNKDNQPNNTSSRESSQQLGKGVSSTVMTNDQCEQNDSVPDDNTDMATVVGTETDVATEVCQSEMEVDEDVQEVPNREISKYTDTHLHTKAYWVALTPQMLKEWQDDMLTFSIDLDADLQKVVTPTKPLIPEVDSSESILICEQLRNCLDQCMHILTEKIGEDREHNHVNGMPQNGHDNVQLENLMSRTLNIERYFSDLNNIVMIDN